MGFSRHKSVIAFSLLAGLALFAAYLVIARGDIRGIREGMSKAEVEAVAGKPHHIRSDGAWYYDGFTGDAAVRFNESDRVYFVDDMFPEYD